MTDQYHGPLSQATVETIAGLSAGLVSTIIVHPLDIIKTRLQISTSPATSLLLGSSLRTLRHLLATEGPPLPALYRGLTPNLLGNSTAWALYFLSYSQAQSLIRRTRHYDPSHPLTSLDYLSASALAGTLTAILTNPIWVVKTRMLSTASTSHGAYPSMLHGFGSIYRTEGLAGYFAGLTPALFGVSHGALYFVAYERFKTWRRSRNRTSLPTSNSNAPLTNTDTLLASSLAKIWAGTLTYPHQLVRTRMQTFTLPAPPASASSSSSSSSSPTQARRKPSLGAVVREIWVREGIWAFYKGLGPNLMRVVPSTCVTFLVYENVRYGLPRMWAGSGSEREVG